MKYLRIAGAAMLALTLTAGVRAQGGAAPGTGAPPPLDLKAVALTAELFSAIGKDDRNAALAALERGADVNRPNWLNFQPLDWAAALGRGDLVTLLLDRGAKRDVSIYGAPTVAAILSGRQDIALTMLERGATTVAHRPDAATTLMLAAAYGAPRVIDRLQPDAAELARQDVDGATPLIYAARLGQIAAMKRLLARGAKVDQADKHGRTPLMYAAMNGFPEAVDLLLRAGAKASARDRENATALHLTARYNGSARIARSLRQAGAGIDGRDRFGKTVLALAQGRRFVELATFLKASGARAVPVPAAPEIRPAIQKSVVALEKGMQRFLAQSACASCHHQGLGLAVLGQARAKGFAVNPSVVESNLKRIGDDGQQAAPLLQLALNDPKMANVVPVSEIDEFAIGASYFFWALDANQVPADPGLGGLAQYVLSLQQPAGNWHFTIHRGPMQQSLHTMTALQALGMRRFLPQEQSAASLKKAQEWFRSAPTRTTEDRAARLLGLRWTGQEPRSLQREAQDLIALQRPDGGWGARPGAASDALTTGLALYSLRAGAEIPLRDGAALKARDYLLRMQDETGAWYVNKTVPPFNYFFDAGFPGGESQYVSFAATGWATLALMEIAAPPKVSRR